MAPFNPFGGGSGISRASLADGNIGDVLTQTGVGTVAMQAPNPGYLEYIIRISQSGTSDPSAIVLNNTLGQTVTWTRSNTGIYLGETLQTAFIDAKTIIIAPSKVQQNTSYTLLTRSDDITLRINTKDWSGANADSILNFYVCIRVYP